MCYDHRGIYREDLENLENLEDLETTRATCYDNDSGDTYDKYCRSEESGRTYDRYCDSEETGETYGDYGGYDYEYDDSEDGLVSRGRGLFLNGTS